MKIYSYISYLLVSISTMIVKAAESPSPSQETSAVNPDTDEPGQSSFISNEFKQERESRSCEIMETSDHKDDDKTPCSFDLGFKPSKSLYVPPEEFDNIFRINSIEKFKNLNDFVSKIKYVRYEWDKLKHLCATFSGKSVNKNKDNENSLFRCLYQALDHVLSFTFQEIYHFGLFVYDHSNKDSSNLYKNERIEFIGRSRSFDLAFPMWFNDNMKILKTHNIFSYNELEKLKISLRCLNYNICSLSLNCFDAFFLKKTVKCARKEFGEYLRHFLYSLKDYITSNNGFNANIDSIIQMYKYIEAYCEGNKNIKMNIKTGRLELTS